MAVDITNLINYKDYCDVLNITQKETPEWFYRNQQTALSIIYKNMTQTHLFPVDKAMFLHMKPQYKASFIKALTYQIKYINENQDLYDNPTGYMATQQIGNYHRGPLSKLDIDTLLNTLAPQAKYHLEQMGWLYKSLNDHYELEQYYGDIDPEDDYATVGYVNAEIDRERQARMDADAQLHKQVLTKQDKLTVNPSGTFQEELNSIIIDGIVYGIGSGSFDPDRYYTKDIIDGKERDLYQEIDTQIEAERQARLNADATMVTLTNTQSISGSKTFTSSNGVKVSQAGVATTAYKADRINFGNYELQFPRESGTIALEGQGGEAVWGGITGTLSDQIDLQNALNLKQNKTDDDLETQDKTIVGSINEVFAKAQGTTVNYVISLLDPVNLPFVSTNPTITATQIKTTDGTVIPANKLTIGASIYNTDTANPDRWLAEINGDVGTFYILRGEKINLSDYQKRDDDNLQTESKTIVGAINEVNAKQELPDIPDTTKTYTLKAVNGVITWVADPDWWDHTDELTEDDIGTTREVEVNGQIHTVRLIGIDHDDLASGNGKAHTTWQFTNLLSDSNGYSLAALWQDTNDTSTSNHDFPNSTMRKCLDGLGSGTLAWYEKGGTTKSTTYTKPVIEMLPQGLQNVLKNVSKQVSIYGSGSFSIRSYNTKVFLLSHSEITNYTLKEGTQYAYWQTHDTATDRIMLQLKGTDGALTSPTSITDSLRGSGRSYAGYNEPTTGYGGIQWLRSPYTGNNDSVCYVYHTGELYESADAYYNAYAVAPCFCI